MSKRTIHLKFTTASGDHVALSQFLKRAIPYYEAPGGVRIRLMQSQEEPGRFIEIVEYETLEAFEHDKVRLEHDSGMKALIGEWRALTTGEIAVETYEDITREI